MRTRVFLPILIAAAALVFLGARLISNDYVFFAGYTVLQFVVLATAWNILGGYTGYVNFGSAAFFALGAYSTVFLHKLYPMPIPILIVVGGVVSGLVGLGMGYLTLRLKLVATTLSGALMGMAGAPFPYYIGYLQPSSAFGLEYAVNSIAMPMIGGTTSWVGPLIGAILLGSLQQYVTVTISSSVNVLVVGALLILFVIIAPNGIVGLVQARLHARRK